MLFTADKTMSFGNNTDKEAKPRPASRPGPSESRKAPAGAYAQYISTLEGSQGDDEEMEVLPVRSGRVGMDGWGQGALRQHVVDQATRLAAIGDSQSLTALRPGQLFLHSTCRPLSATQSMQLCSLARLTHARHFNHHIYNFDEIFIPGGLIVGLTISVRTSFVY